MPALKKIPLKPWTLLLVIVAVVLALMISLRLIPGWVVEQDEVAEYSHQRLMRLNIEVSNISNRVAEDAVLELFLPMELPGRQTVKRVNSSVDYETANDNGETTFNLDRIPPFGRKVVSISLVVGLSEQPSRVTLDSTQTYLDAESLVEATAPEIIALANQLRADTSRETIKQIQKWVSREISFTGYLHDDRGARNTLNSKIGDSSEFMFLTLALARASAIPARGVGGFIITENTVLSAADYHNWVEVYINGTWHVVDPQNNRLFETGQGYVVHRQLFPRISEATEDENAHTFFRTNHQQILSVAF